MHRGLEPAWNSTNTQNMACIMTNRRRGARPKKVRKKIFISRATFFTRSAIDKSQAKSRVEQQHVTLPNCYCNDHYLSPVHTLKINYLATITAVWGDPVARTSGLLEKFLNPRRYARQVGSSGQGLLRRLHFCCAILEMCVVAFLASQPVWQ